MTNMSTSFQSSFLGIRRGCSEFKVNSFNAARIADRFNAEASSWETKVFYLKFYFFLSAETLFRLSAECVVYIGRMVYFIPFCNLTNCIFMVSYDALIHVYEHF